MATEPPPTKRNLPLTPGRPTRMPSKSPTRSPGAQPGASDPQIRSRDSPEPPGRPSSATTSSTAPSSLSAPAPRLAFPRGDVGKSEPSKSAGPTTGGIALAGPAPLRHARVASGWEAR